MEHELESGNVLVGDFAIWKRPAAVKLYEGEVFEGKIDDRIELEPCP